MKPLIIFSIIFIVIFLQGACYGDVIEPGMKDVKISYKITNIEEYPDYIFFLHGNPSPHLEIINSSKFSFYKLSIVSIYAVKKASISEDELKSMDNMELDNFIKENPGIKSLVLQDHKRVSDLDPLNEMLITLHIDSVNSLEIKKSSVIYKYDDGSTDEKTIADQNSIPEPSKKNTPKDLYFVLPLVAIIGIVLIIFKIKWS